MHLRLHFCLVTRGICQFGYLNKRNLITQSSSLSLPDIPIIHSVSKDLYNTLFGLIQNHLLIKKMTTARLSGKTINDVLYPPIEPHKTGMLKVSTLHQ